jgi:hypothetical protein
VPSEVNRQNGADDYEANEHDGDHQRRRDRAYILGRLVRYGAFILRRPEQAVSRSVPGKTVFTN